MMRASMPKETSHVQRFIRENQGRLVQRALATLATAADDELAFQFHRLAGTLGSYQLSTTAHRLLELEEQARSGSATPDILRASALDELQRAQTALGAAA